MRASDPALRFLAVVLLVVPQGTLVAQTYAPPTNGDYGAMGTNSVYLHSFTNPVHPSANGTTLVVSVYHPGSVINTNLPTIFVAHGFTSPAGNAANYSGLLSNLASRGYNVVFSPYEGGVVIFNVTNRFDELTTGFQAAVTNYHLNTEKVGFAGHSYGGGILPAVIQFAMLGKASSYRAGYTWGSSAAFLFVMAPYYVTDGGNQTGVTNTQCIVVPTNLNVVVQVYADDTVVDPRMAIDIFCNLTTLNSQKDFHTVSSDSHGTPAQQATHFLPNTDVAMTSTSLQAWAIFRRMDALAAWTFAGDAVAREIALGNGVAAETTNGVWSDSVSVVPLGVTDLPLSGSYATGAYAATWGSAVNPRGKFSLVSGPPQVSNAGVLPGKFWMTATGLLSNHSYAVQTSSNLPASSWTIATNFVPVRTSLTLTNTATGSTGQFWRILAP